MPASRNVQPDDRLELMVKVAELYHEHHKTQQEIADLTGISRSAVSRLLTAAAAEGVVRIQVVNPRSRARELSLQLQKSLGLRDALVVPTALSDIELTRLKVARAAATYLVEHLSPGDMLGVGRGHTVYETVRALPLNRRLRVSTVPLVGGLGEADAHFQVNELAHEAADRLGGKCWHLYAPAILRNRRGREALLEDSGMLQVTDQWDHLQWALVGIGSITDPANQFYLHAITRFRANTGRDRVVGDVCLWFTESDGNVPMTPNAERVIGISPDQLRRTPHVLGVAGGIRKAEAILAAARGGLIKMLVTDELAAEAILALLAKSAPGVVPAPAATLAPVQED